MNVKKVSTGVSMALACLAVTGPSYAQRAGSDMNAWHGGWSWGWGHMLFSPLVMILLAGAVALIIIVAMCWDGTAGQNRKSPSGDRHHALAIIEERYARGEIDADEFAQRMRALADGTGDQSGSRR